MNCLLSLSGIGHCSIFLSGQENCPRWPRASSGQPWSPPASHLDERPRRQPHLQTHAPAAGFPPTRIGHRPGSPSPTARAPRLAPRRRPPPPTANFPTRPRACPNQAARANLAAMPLPSVQLQLQQMASVPERSPDVARPSPGLELGLEPMAARIGSGGSIDRMKLGGMRTRKR
jgi:hypothetical protein